MRSLLKTSRIGLNVDLAPVGAGCGIAPGGTGGDSASTMNRTGLGAIVLYLAVCFRRDRAGATGRAERGSG